MSVRFLFRSNQALLVFYPLLFAVVFFGCRRSTEDQIVIPPATFPLAREYIGYGVVNVSFTHLLNKPGPDGVSIGYLRRGTVVRIIERRQIINRGNSESWVLAEGNYQSVPSDGHGTSSQGWLQEATLEIYENESRANTASRVMRL